MSANHQTPEYQRAARGIRPKIAATLPAPCVECGGPVTPDQRWQVGHKVDAARGKAMGMTAAQINSPSNFGPVHTKGRGQRACNQIAGGKLGAQMANANRTARRMTRAKFPDW